MPKVDLSFIGKKRGPVPFDYTWREVVLYALAVGASTDELSIIYEKAPGGLKVLPSFCVVPAIRAFPLVGEEIEWSLFLHGEQAIRLFRPLPPEGRILQAGEVKQIYDKGKGAVYRIVIEGWTEEGGPLYEADWSVFYLGAGNFGGDPGPKSEPILPPKGVDPDFTVTDKVAENQAALYRLCGDLNPLHLDPEAARRGGFDRPILHGLCTYGFAVRAIVNGPLGGEVSRLRGFRARFSNVVYPGDLLTTRGWRTDAGYIVETTARDTIVLSNGVAEVEA